MTDNPFNEPADHERTVVQKIGPGARAAAPRQAAAGPSWDAAPLNDLAPRSPEPLSPSAGAESSPRVGVSPMAAAAAPLLDLLGRISAQGGQSSSGDELRRRAMRSLDAFEAECRKADIPAEEIRAGHFALCAALDDVALSTPWGQASSWPAHSLASSFHHDVKAGERFFVVLANLQKEPGRFRQPLEICYLCLSLGLQGQYRLTRNGMAELDRIRESLYQLLVDLRGGFERELSPSWRGVDAPNVPLGRHVPTWVAAAVAAAAIGFGYFWLLNQVSADTDGLQQNVSQLPPAGMPSIVRPPAARPADPPPPPPPPNSVLRLRQFLAPEIREGLVSVEGDPQTILVRLRGRGMFSSGSADLDPRFARVLTRIGEALRTEPGRVLVLGHTDNQPIRTVRYPSNFQLSAARAKAAAAILTQVADGGDRIASEGRADMDSLTSNGTPEGREMNRRIEIVIQQSAGR